MQADWSPDGATAVFTRINAPGASASEIWTASVGGADQAVAQVTSSVALGVETQAPSWQAVLWSRHLRSPCRR